MPPTIILPTPDPADVERARSFAFGDCPLPRETQLAAVTLMAGCVLRSRETGMPFDILRDEVFIPFLAVAGQDVFAPDYEVWLGMRERLFTALRELAERED